MSDIQPSAFRVDPLLTGLAIDFLNKPSKFVAEQIMPTLTVQSETGIYYEFDKSSIREEDTSRAQGTPAKVSTFGLTEVPYGPIDNHALKHMVTDRQAKQFGKTQAEKRAMGHLIQQLMLKRERKLAADMASTSIITQYTTLSASTDKWSDYSNSTPLDDVEVAKAAVRSGCLNLPNVMLIGSYDAYSAIRNHPDLIGRINGLKDSLSLEMIASIFGVEKVILADAQYNTARQGATDSLSDVWGDHVWLLYVNPQAAQDMDYITLGHTLRVEGEDGGDVSRTLIKTLRDEDAEGNWIRASTSYEHHFCATGAAYRIGSVV